MADKDFKVKTGLDLPAPLPVVEGGTGQNTANNALNAMLPDQTGHSNKVLHTNGTNTSWQTPSVSPTIVQWKKTMSGGETSLSGNDDNSVSLTYSVNREMLFINGVLQVRGSDYTATNGTTITGLSALALNDVVNIWSFS
jgi:hypothetical protein